MEMLQADLLNQHFASLPRISPFVAVPIQESKNFTVPGRYKAVTNYIQEEDLPRTPFPLACFLVASERSSVDSDRTCR